MGFSTTELKDGVCILLGACGRSQPFHKLPPAGFLMAGCLGTLAACWTGLTSSENDSGGWKSLYQGGIL